MIIIKPYKFLIELIELKIELKLMELKNLANQSDCSILLISNLVYNY